MKKLLILCLAVVMFSSCAVTRIFPREMSAVTTFLDFRPYTENGFFLSPNDYPGKYIPIGQLYVVVEPEILVEKYGDYYSYVTAEEKPISTEVLLELAVADAIDKGANGISNIKIEIVSDQYTYAKNETPNTSTVRSMTVSKYIISGFCIKIEN